MTNDIFPWLFSREAAREKITKAVLADVDLAAAISAHDLALAALVSAQEFVPKRLESIDTLSVSQHEWLSTFALIFQSIDVPRSMILQAAYAPSCALLKQEWDGVSVLASIFVGKKLTTKSPNVLNALGKTAHKEHRLLQPIAHLTGKGLGRAWAVDVVGDTDKYRPTTKIMSDVMIRLLDARSYMLGHLFLQLQLFLEPVQVLESEEKLLRVLAYLDS